LRRTSRLLVLFGIGLAVLTFVVILVLLPGGTNPNTPKATAPADVQVVIAVADIGIGTTITSEMLDTRKVPLAGKSANALADPSQAIGQVVRSPIAAGAQVTLGALGIGEVKQTQLVVPPGFRAFTVEVNQLTGVGNLIQIGDTVDVVISLTGGAFPVVQVDSAGTISVVPGLNPQSVKIPLILQEVQVIGIIDAPVAAPAQPAASAATTPTLTGASRLVTLAVTPAQAEVLVFVRDLNMQAELGTPDHVVSQLDLILRSPLDKGVTVATDGVILKTLVDKYGVLPPQLVQTILPR
jgi:Flp pilus assembly protein CpaB